MSFAGANKQYSLKKSCYSLIIRNFNYCLLWLLWKQGQADSGNTYDLVPQWSTTVKMWSVKLALYTVWRGGTELAGFETQHSLHLQSPKFTTSRAVAIILRKWNWSLVLSIFCFSLKVLKPGLKRGKSPVSGPYWQHWASTPRVLPLPTGWDAIS